MAIIDIQEISKHYNSREILIDLELKMNAGEFVAILGKSGSGKSTLINIVGLLDSDFSGKYFLDDINISCCSRKMLSLLRNQKLGFVFQMYNLINGYTVKDNILLPTLYNKKGMKTNEYYQSLLEKLQISSLENQHALNLSGGEKQRVAIARAAINKPSIIIADEPTGNLDSENTKNVLDTFNYLKKKNVAVLMVTHDVSVASKADKVFYLDEGKLVCN